MLSVALLGNVFSRNSISGFQRNETGIPLVPILFPLAGFSFNPTKLDIIDGLD